MDSAKASPLDAHKLSLAVSHRTIQMLKPDLSSVEILGFYLLTDDIEARKPGGGKGKKRIYENAALRMNKAFKDKLQYLTSFEITGGAAWILSAKPYGEYEQYKLLESELAKQLRVAIC